MDKKYWENYYKNKKIINKPSPFALFVMKEYLGKKGKLIEMGCGNGRDSVFFSKKNIRVTAIDQCKTEINRLSKEHSNIINFKCDDFTHLPNEQKFNYIYSRFTLHSVSEKEEDKIISWVKKNIEKNGLFMIEARGIKNELYGLGEKIKKERNAFLYENHYRRFIEIKKLIKKLIKNDFKILYQKESTGFSPFKQTDQHFIRVIARKN